ncbi:MAG: hypothetical protein AB1324_04800 [Candidatus Micrarchaeota archaeon]
MERKEGRVKKAWKKARKPLMYAAIVAASAITGATCSTSFKYRYNHHDYIAGGAPRPAIDDQQREALGRRIRELRLEPLEDAIMHEITSPRVFLYGAAAPEETRLELDSLGSAFRMTYWMRWSNDHIIPKTDWEPVTLIYTIAETDLVLTRAYVRPHNALAEYDRRNCGRLLDNHIPVVVGNPSHSLGIPGCDYSVSWGPVQAFTRFAHEDWAGCSISWGLPQGFSQIGMNITSGSPPAEAKSTPYYNQQVR